MAYIFDPQQYPDAPLTGSIIHAAHVVFDELGSGFLEKVYENSLAFLLRQQGLNVRQQAPIQIGYRGHIVGEYVADLIVEGRVITEVKAARAWDTVFESQLLNYLKATRCQVGIIVNFGTSGFKARRMVFSHRVHQSEILLSSSVRGEAAAAAELK